MCIGTIDSYKVKQLSIMKSGVGLVDHQHLPIDQTIYTKTSHTQFLCHQAKALFSFSSLSNFQVYDTPITLLNLASKTDTVFKRQTNRIGHTPH